MTNTSTVKKSSAFLKQVTLFAVLLFISISSFVSAQNIEPIYDEMAVPFYTLPDPLVLIDGAAVTTTKCWWEVRRNEIIGMFENEMYGKTPTEKLPFTFRVISIDKNALNGAATRKEITLFFKGNGINHSMNILLYVPNNSPKPVPVFFSLNFDGNHTINPDTGITISHHWVECDSGVGYMKNNDKIVSRGGASERWPVERIIERGYALATVYYGDLYPDHKNAASNSILPMFYKKGQTAPDSTEWGAIGAWAWGYSRAMDYFEKDKDINSSKVVIMGHSRLGKATLWAGAQDKRFAIVISNNSGCGGAALSKRAFGETVGIINNSFPHWFCANFKKYNNNEAALPFDQHMLLALIAPRPLYVASAEDDLWADPKGEFLAALNASPVYKLLGTCGLQANTQPAVNDAIMSTIGYHIRSGKHDVTGFEWERYMDFTDKHLKVSKR